MRQDTRKECPPGCTPTRVFGSGDEGIRNDRCRVFVCTSRSVRGTHVVCVANFEGYATSLVPVESIEQAVLKGY
eukprot:3240713-Rhodomonas_salina.2